MSDHIPDTNKMVSWAVEPTPITDAARFHRDSAEHEFDDMVTTSDCTRNIERRMRAAERFLHEALTGGFFIEFPRTDGEIKRHLEAARKEDEHANF